MNGNFGGTAGIGLQDRLHLREGVVVFLDGIRCDAVVGDDEAKTRRHEEVTKVTKGRPERREEPARIGRPDSSLPFVTFVTSSCLRVLSGDGPKRANEGR